MCNTNHNTYVYQKGDYTMIMDDNIEICGEGWI